MTIGNGYFSASSDSLNRTDFVATAADASPNEKAISPEFVKAMKPVQLDPEREKEFEGFFFPTGKKARSFLIPVLESLSETTANINMFYRFLRELMAEAGTLSRMDHEVAQSRINNHFTEMLARKRDAGHIKDNVQSFLKATRSPNTVFHNVYNSDRYATGVDIVLNGIGDDVRGEKMPPTFFGSTDADLGNAHMLPNGSSTSGPVDMARYNKWMTRFGEGLINTAKEMNVLLFGTGAISNRTIHRGISLNTNFEEIQEIFARNTGFRLPEQMVTNMHVTNHLAEQFLQIEVLKVPSKFVKEAVANFRRVTNDTTGSGGFESRPNQRSLHEVNAIIDERFNGSDRYVAPEAEAMNVVLRTSIRFTVEEDIARYVSQSANTERLSLSRINAWFGMYIGQILRAKITAPKKGEVKVSNEATIAMDSIPRYAMGASTMKKLSAIRTQNGFVTEKTKGNGEDMYVTPTGTFAVRPSDDALQSVNIAEDYEKLSDDILELLSRYNIPMQAFLNDPKVENWSHIDPEDIERLWSMMQELKLYDGSVLSFSWDYGIQVKAGRSPGRINSSIENGAVRPDALTIADQLGFNLAREGETPMVRNFATTIHTLTYAHAVEDVPVESERMYGTSEMPEKFAQSQVVKDIIELYLKLAYVDGKAPRIEELAKTAMRNLGMDKLPVSKGRDFSPLYLEHFNSDGTMRPSSILATRTIPIVLLSAAMQQAAGGPGSQLWDETYDTLKTADASPKSFQVLEELENHPDYFNSSTSTAADFPRLYKYFGGQVFKLILDAINAIPASEYFNTRKMHVQAEIGPNPGYQDGRQVKMGVWGPNNATILQSILPFTIMLGKYAPNHEAIFAEAQEQVDAIQPDPSFSTDDLKVPGLVDDPNHPRAIFPHQASTQSYLRGKVAPSFAILALDPGGGKTGQGVIDMACIVRDFSSVGGVVKPLVICPNGLISTWCEDAKYFLGGNWNVFPLDSDILARWGQDKLLELIDNAPPNTLFIAGMHFISGRTVKLAIGNAQIDLSMNLEMVRRIGCSWIAIDESHNLKNHTSSRHKSVKMLTTATVVKWKRLLTGTIMPDRARDIEGQIMLHSPAIFRSGEIAKMKGDDAESEIVTVFGKPVPTYTPLNAKRAVDKLGHHCAFIVKKRKEWAFMLPAPIESFLAIGMADEDGTDGTSPAELEQQRLHQQMYATVLQKTLEALQALIDQKEKADAAAEDDDTFEADPENDEDFADQRISQKAWETNLARLERLIIAPEFDEDFELVFGKGAVFHSRKAKFIAARVEEHFNPPKWRRGGPYNEYDLVSHDGTLYVARKWNNTDPKFVALPPEAMQLPPSELPDFWKQEPEGKLIIITRYNRSARAIYNALSAERKRQTVLFTGDEPDKVKGFNAFKTDPEVKILIANEQGMSEGHNLQLASRIIRAESPWGPGALNQTSARIFRPDPKGAIAASKGEGEMVRDVIFLDWVLANNTMEVPKLARVISKSFGISRFTEADNPLYADLFDNHRVPTEREDSRLRLGVEMLKNILGLGDQPFKKMALAYKALNEVENSEFKKMRQEQPAVMLQIFPDEPIPGSAEMAIRPFVANQPIIDPHNWKPVNVENMLRDEKIANNYEKELYGKEVITELGTGKIVNFTTKQGSGGKAISSIKVRLKNPPPGFDEWQTVNPNIAYIPSAPISNADHAKYFDVPTDRTPTDAKKSERAAQILEREREAREREEEKEKEIARRKSVQTIRVEQKDTAEGQQRKKNVARGRPANEGVYFVEGEAGIPKPEGAVIPPGGDGTIAIVPENIEDNEVSVYPAFYHGFATLEAEFDEASVDLKKLGFKQMPAYAYVDVVNKKKYIQIYEYLDENFDLRDKTVSLIEQIIRAFPQGMKNTHKLWYDIGLAPLSELPSFFSINKRIVENRREVRVFPVFMEDHVRLCIDIRTNPAIVKHLGKTIPGTGLKWNKMEPQWFYFGKNKTDLRDMIAKIKRNGYNVVNQKQALKDLAEIKFRFRKEKE